MRPKREPAFSTESALCAAFIAWAQPQGWTAYAETAGWDILLVAADGTQIGVQAKLKFNLDVLSQAVSGDEWNSSTGPDFRAVLTPGAGRRDLCDALGITSIHHQDRSYDSRPRHDFYPSLPGSHGHNMSTWHYANPVRRCNLPDYVPDVPAGASGPVQLTEWKINALRIVAVGELRGYVTRADFKRIGIDHRRWAESDWMRPADVPGRFTITDTGGWAQQHPGVYPQVRADVEKEIATEGAA